MLTCDSTEPAAIVRDNAAAIVRDNTAPITSAPSPLSAPLLSQPPSVTNGTSPQRSTQPLNASELPPSPSQDREPSPNLAEKKSSPEQYHQPPLEQYHQPPLQQYHQPPLQQVTSSTPISYGKLVVMNYPHPMVSLLL